MDLTRMYSKLWQFAQPQYENSYAKFDPASLYFKFYIFFPLLKNNDGNICIFFQIPTDFTQCFHEDLYNLDTGMLPATLR